MIKSPAQMTPNRVLQPTVASALRALAPAAERDCLAAEGYIRPSVVKIQPFFEDE